jgi:hypothetical protein
MKSMISQEKLGRQALVSTKSCLDSFPMTLTIGGCKMHQGLSSSRRRYILCRAHSISVCLLFLFVLASPKVKESSKLNTMQPQKKWLKFVALVTFHTDTSELNNLNPINILSHVTPFATFQDETCSLEFANFRFRQYAWNTREKSLTRFPNPIGQ